MAGYSVEEIQTKQQIREFLELPKRMYRDDPMWICPLDTDVESPFDPARNELLADGEAVRWLLRDVQGTVVGRIAAFYNPDLAAACEQPTGGCGFFECPNDPEASALLFDAARDWLRSKGMEAMDGPINFGDRNAWWGVLTDGFTEPLYCTPYNFPYYKELFEAYGFRNYFNQYTYLREIVLDRLNPSVVRRADRLFGTPGYRFEYAGNKRLEDYAEDFRTVYNKGWATYTGVKPIDSRHALQLMKTLKPIVDVKLLYFAYFEDRPIGFFIMLPDLNRIVGRFGGKFGLLQKMRLLWDLKVRRKVDRAFGVIFGVIPEFQGKGVEAGMIRRFEEEVAKGLPYKTLEMSWIGDFNPVMMRVAESYVCATRYKTHVTYRYLFDRDREFTRAPKLGRASRGNRTLGSE